MRLNDIPYLVKNNQGTPFTDTVRLLLKINRILFYAQINIQTKRINAHFDFAISEFENIHPKLIRTITRPGSTDQAKAFTFDVQEVQATRCNEQFILFS